jgi:hypothetical protein
MFRSLTDFVIAIGWAQKGINPADVPDASFKFTKIGSAGKSSFLSWGFIELKADQLKRTKNSRRMHMVFHVTSGAVEVKVHDNEFTVHKGGVWQVPRGESPRFFGGFCFLCYRHFSSFASVHLFIFTRTFTSHRTLPHNAGDDMQQNRASASVRR